MKLWKLKLQPFFLCEHRLGGGATPMIVVAPDAEQLELYQEELKTDK